MALAFKYVWAAQRFTRVNVFLIHFLALLYVYVGSGSPVSQQLCTRVVKQKNQKNLNKD